MLDALPLVLVDRMCLFLSDIRDSSALEKTCKQLRWAGLGPECKWHWRLSIVQSLKLYHSCLRDKILRAGTAVRELDLSWTGVTDVSALGNVHTLYLISTNATDVSALGDIHTLYLMSTKVTNVSALGNVHKLNLENTGVTNVSALGNVYALDVQGTRVTDVSALSNVRKLTLPNGRKRKRND